MVSKCWQGTRGKHTGKMQTRENIKLFTLLHICKLRHLPFLCQVVITKSSFTLLVITSYNIMIMFIKKQVRVTFFLNNTMVIHFFFIYVRYVDVLYNKISILIHLLKLIYHHLLFYNLFSCIVKSWKLWDFLQDLHFLLRVEILKQFIKTLCLCELFIPLATFYFLIHLLYPAE